MAAPVVSGAVALILQKDPSLTPDQVKARLMKAASKTNFVKTYTAVDAAAGGSYVINHDLFTGAGELDITAALANTDKPATSLSAMSPVAAYSNGNQTGTNTGNTTNGTSVISGSSVIWGLSMIWGSSTMSGNSVIWGSGGSVASTGAALASKSSSTVLSGDK